MEKSFKANAEKGVNGELNFYDFHRRMSFFGSFRRGVQCVDVIIVKFNSLTTQSTLNGFYCVQIEIERDHVKGRVLKVERGGK
jgi:hypothetical protein